MTLSVGCKGRLSRGSSRQVQLRTPVYDEALSASPKLPGANISNSPIVQDSANRGYVWNGCRDAKIHLQVLAIEQVGGGVGERSIHFLRIFEHTSQFWPASCKGFW